MIEKIIGRLTEEAMASSSAQTEAIIGMQGASANFYSGEKSAYEKAIEIVQEVAQEYGYCRKLNRCDTCNHYVADEVPPICYFCCKDMEDNYQQKGE